MLILYYFMVEADYHIATMISSEIYTKELLLNNTFY